MTGRDVPTTWNINGANTYSNGANTLSFSGVEILVGGSAADTFIITGAQAFSLHGGAGNDSFLFNNGASLTGSLDGGSGTDTLDFSAYATARSVILTGADATGFSGTQPAISGGFTGIDVLVGSAATNDNLTDEQGPPPGTIGAADTYRTRTATLDFSGYENLLGGGGNDTFAFTGSGSVKGTVNGGLGTDWLDYSLYGTGVHVNLFSSPVTVGTLTYPALSATGVFGGLANGLLNFANITGSASNDVLIGDNNPNVINGGRATTRCGPGRQRHLPVCRWLWDRYGRGTRRQRGAGYARLLRRDPRPALHDHPGRPDGGLQVEPGQRQRPEH